MKKVIYAVVAAGALAALAWGIYQNIQLAELNREASELVSEAQAQNKSDQQFLDNLPAEIKIDSEPEKVDKPIEISLGKFKLTAYCRDEKCCGKKPSNPLYGITSTGAEATAGRTVAVDPKVITYGTKLVINGHEYTAEDCGGGIKGNHIDIFFESYNEAVAFGVQYA